MHERILRWDLESLASISLYLPTVLSLMEQLLLQTYLMILMILLEAEFCCQKWNWCDCCIKVEVLFCSQLGPCCEIETVLARSEGQALSRLWGNCSMLCSRRTTELQWPTFRPARPRVSLHPCSSQPSSSTFSYCTQKQNFDPVKAKVQGCSKMKCLLGLTDCFLKVTAPVVMKCSYVFNKHLNIIIQTHCLICSICTETDVWNETLCEIILHITPVKVLFSVFTRNVLYSWN